MKSFRVFILLLGIAITIDSCNGLCNNDNEYGRCKQINDMFEQALVEQESNSFALHSLFYPSNGHPASNFIAIYKLILPSQDVGNTTDLKMTREEKHIRGWCKSNVYTIANPVMLDTLFVGLTYPYYIVVSRQYTMYKTLVLNLTRYNLTDEEINYGINYITPWLKLYAKREFQTGKVGYIDDEKGYIYDIYAYNWILTLTAMIVTITAICISSKILHNLFSVKSKRAEIKWLFFFSFVSVVSLINVVDIGIEAYGLYWGFTIEENFDLPRTFKATLTKIKYHKTTELIVGILIFCIGGIIGQILACCYLPEAPKYLSIYLCIPNCCFCCCVYFFQFGNFFYFTYTIGLNIVPTFMMFFIAPIETISVVVFFLTQLTSAVMAMALIATRFNKKYEKTIGKRKKQKLCTAVCSIFLYTSVLLSAVFLIAIFLKILSRVNTNNTSYLAPVFLSLGSTIVPILIGYVSKQVMNDSSSIELGERSTDEDDSDIELKPLVPST